MEKVVAERKFPEDFEEDPVKAVKKYRWYLTERKILRSYLAKEDALEDADIDLYEESMDLAYEELNSDTEYEVDCEDDAKDVNDALFVKVIRGRGGKSMNFEDMKVEDVEEQNDTSFAKSLNSNEPGTSSKLHSLGDKNTSGGKDTSTLGRTKYSYRPY
jgi:hypothetical protein